MATYYVAEGGTAANKAAATSGTYPDGCMTVAVHNGETFAANDFILFSDEGGVIRAQPNFPSSGTSGNPITYGAKSGDTPIISGADVLETWVQEGSEDNYLSTPGESGDRANVPDHANIDLTGDLDLRADLAMDDWTPSAGKFIILKGWLTYGLQVNTDGTLKFFWYDSGGTHSLTSSAATGFSDGTRHSVRCTFDADNGSSGADVKFYTCDDFSTWSQLGTTQTHGSTVTIIANNNVLELAGGAGSEYAGKTYRSQVRSGIDGTIQVDAIFSNEEPETTSFTEDSGNGYTVTIAQSGDPQAEIIAGAAAGNVYSKVTSQVYGVAYDGVMLMHAPGDTDGVGADTWDWDAGSLYVNVGEDPDTGVLEGSIRDRGINTNNKNWCTIDGLTIRGGRYSGVRIGNATGAGITINDCILERNCQMAVDIEANTSSSEIYVTDNTIRENGGSGIRCYYNSDGGDISGNTIYGNGLYSLADSQAYSGMDGQFGNFVIHHNSVYENSDSDNAYGSYMCHGIYNGTDTDKVIIYENLIYGHEKGAGVKLVSDGDVYLNKIYDNGGEGVEVGHNSHDGYNTEYNIYNNVIYGNLWSGIRQDSKANGTMTLNIYNNTFYDNGGTNQAEISLEDSLTVLNIKNNIFFATDSQRTFVSLAAQSGTVDIDYNCHWRTDGDPNIYHGENRTWTYWTETLGFDANGILDNPDLTAVGSGDLTLTSVSPCIGAGVDLGDTYTDALMPSSTWPDGVVTGDQDDY